MRDLTMFPAMKNGKFIGYADARQIAENPELELFSEERAKVIEAEKKVEAEKRAKESAGEKKAVADPADVKKK